MPWRPVAGLATVGVEPAGTPRASLEPAQPPQRLSETGLFLADGSIDPRNRPFVPQYPLWSDGAAKSRWIRLPEGAKIDVSDIDAWRFPAGTTFWKEFAWGGRKVETRMIRALGGGEWMFATYVWTEDQKDAAARARGGRSRGFRDRAGKDALRFRPSPTVNACHRSSPSVVLGFNALQLSDDRDPLAPHAEPLGAGAITLRTLVAEDRLEPPRPDLALRPPRIRESDPVARAALGYLSANCGGCHNDRGPLARLGFVLLPRRGRRAGLAGAGARHRRRRSRPLSSSPESAPTARASWRPARPSRARSSTACGRAAPPRRCRRSERSSPTRTSIHLVRRWIESLATPPEPAI